MLRKLSRTKLLIKLNDVEHILMSFFYANCNFYYNFQLLRKNEVAYKHERILY